MKHYGTEPPWSKETSYGWWKNVGELWEDGYAWELQPPRGAMARLDDILRNFYLPPLVTMLNEPLFPRLSGAQL